MKLINRIAGLMMVAWLALSPVAYASTDAASAFSGLISSTNTSVDQPGYLHSATRNVFVGGSMHMWIPRDNVQLISISPPAFSAGCGGIDFFMGGFSFINAAQFQQLIKNVMQAAIGYAIQLGIRTLCPMCADILATLQKLAQQANKMGVDSCQMAQNLINGAIGYMGDSVSSKGVVTDSKGNNAFFGAPSAGSNPSATGTGDAKNTNAECSMLAAKAGDSDSFLGAMNSVCNGMSSAIGKINSYLDNPIPGTSKEGIASMLSDTVGNKLWIGMTQAGYADTAFKELVLSVNGFTVTPSQGGKPGQSVTYNGWGPTLKVTGSPVSNVLIAILMFGTDPKVSFQKFISSGGALSQQDMELMKSTISDIENMKYTSLPLYVCGNANATDDSSAGKNFAPPTTAMTGSGTSDVLKMCQYAYNQTVSGSTNPLITPDGLYEDVYSILTQAVNNVATDKPIPSDAIALMQITPLPLYKMINVAAVYPGAATQLVQTYSYLISALIIQSLVSNWAIPTATANGMQGLGNGDAMNMAQGLVQAIAATTDSAAGSIGTALREQQAILASLKAINSTIYQRLSSTGIQGNLLFSQQLVPH